jgi:hypothetical protein
VVIKYYFFNGQRAQWAPAMRQNGVLSYLDPEHLGGNLFATDTGGTKSSVQGYYGYGQHRSGTACPPRPEDTRATPGRS